jgi:hypothetical protein
VILEQLGVANITAQGVNRAVANTAEIAAGLHFPIQNLCRPRIGGERPSDEGRTRCRHRDDRPVMNRPRL